MYKNLVQLTSRAFSVSYRHGPHPTPIKYLTIGQQLTETAHRFPNHPAVISAFQNVTLTYPQLQEKAQVLAASLVHLGFERGDRIGIYSPNNYEWIIVQYAAAIAGLILVNINPAYQSSELKYALNKVGCKGIITANKFKSSNYIEILNEILPELKTSKPNQLSSQGVPSLKLLVRLDDEQTLGFLNFKELFDMPGSDDYQKLGMIQNSIGPEDAINIQFTSGTTGNPKGATLSHLNILNNGERTAQRVGFSDKDGIALSVPLYHCFGMIVGNMATLSCGAAICLPSEAFSAKATLEAVEKYKLTTLYGVPTMFLEYIKEKEVSNRDTSTLRKGIIAGALAPRPLMEAIMGKLNVHEISNGYGMTETSPFTVMTHPNDSFERKVSTVGNVMDHCEIKIADTEGKALPYETPGEYWARGYPTMIGYWGDDANTMKTKSLDGWVRSGDIASMDETGYVKIVGRIKDMIIRGGENVYPKEIEDFLLTQDPNIEDVQCFGVPDEKFGEEICVWIKRKDPSKELPKTKIKEYCHKKIAHYKMPKFVVCVEDIPMTVTGKPQKFKMRDIMAHELKNPAKVQEYMIR